MAQTQERIKTSKSETSQSSAVNKKVTGSTQSFIPIKKIRNGIIETKDGRYVKILEILPINFDMQAASERNMIIWQFASWIKTAPVRMQFKVISRKAESSGHIEAILREQESENLAATAINKEIEELDNRPATPKNVKKLKDLRSETEGYRCRSIHAKEYVNLVEQLSRAGSSYASLFYNL